MDFEIWDHQSCICNTKIIYLSMIINWSYKLSWNTYQMTDWCLFVERISHQILSKYFTLLFEDDKNRWLQKNNGPFYLQLQSRKTLKL